MSCCRQPHNHSPPQKNSNLDPELSLRQGLPTRGTRAAAAQPQQLLDKHHLPPPENLESGSGALAKAGPTDRREHERSSVPPRSLTEYKYPADPSVKYQGHRREALTMGVPPQQLDWHLFVVLGISNSAREQGETKISPGCHSNRHAVLQPVKLPSFGFER